MEQQWVDAAIKRFAIDFVGAEKKLASAIDAAGSNEASKFFAESAAQLLGSAFDNLPPLVRAKIERVRVKFPLLKKPSPPSRRKTKRSD